MRLIKEIRELLKGPRHLLSSYSQEGEDLVLRRFLDENKKGFYVDIGAHHPKRFSNTARYYALGWRGINIDADPELMQEFNTQRDRDVNVVAGVGVKSSNMTFYVFNEKAINTFDEKLANDRAKMPEYRIEQKVKVPVRSLEQILNRRLPKGQEIDFMSIDVEGKDLEVLRSNNWDKFRPKFVLVECLKATSSLEAVLEDPVTKFLKKKGYQPVAKTLYTVIFGEKDE